MHDVSNGNDGWASQTESGYMSHLSIVIVRLSLAVIVGILGIAIALFLQVLYEKARTRK